MKKKLILCLTIFVISSCKNQSHEIINNQKIINLFPKAERNFIKTVINLPKLKNENNYKVEIIIDKKQIVDCNYHFFSGVINKKTLNGFGYDYFIINNEMPMASTRMACPAEKQKISKNIEMNHNLDLLKYNSKLPIIIYSPEHLNVKYRIWKTKDKIKNAIID